MLVENTILRWVWPFQTQFLKGMLLSNEILIAVIPLLSIFVGECYCWLVCLFVCLWDFVFWVADSMTL